MVFFSSPHYSAVRAGVASLVLACVLIACGGTDEVVQEEQNPNVPTAQKARAQLNEALRAFNNACVVPHVVRGGRDWPITVLSHGDSDRSQRRRQLQALHSAGVLTSETLTGQRGDEQAVYRLAEGVQESRQEIVTGRGWQSALCFATPQVTRIDTIEALYKRSTRRLAEVTFHYRYSSIASWAQQAGVQRAFPQMSTLVRHAQTEHKTRQTLVKNNGEWVDTRLQRSRAQAQR